MAFCYILVDEQAGQWSEDDEHAVVNTIRQTSSWMMQEAGKKNVTLNIRNFVFRSKSDVHVDLGMSNAWVKQVMQNTKYASITELRNHFKKNTIIQLSYTPLRIFPLINSNILIF